MITPQLQDEAFLASVHRALRPSIFTSGGWDKAGFWCNGKASICCSIRISPTH